MGMPVLIYGKSGSGKSRSMKEFAEDEIFLVNVERKYLPFRKKFAYTYDSDDVEKIKAGLQKMPTKTAVIDDAGYILTNIFMRGNSRKHQGGDVFDLYNKIGYSFWSLFEFIKTDLPKDVIVYIIMHDETDDYGSTKLKMLGKLLEQKVCVEGMVTICLRCITDEKGHHFLTNTDGNDITKSPEEMFTEKVIDNDLKFVDTTIRKYYEI
ncbi:MAG: AAA family ATPase [Clostridia bacterium]|nr:AAA family ATPase [Clostridia bacterium]